MKIVFEPTERFTNLPRNYQDAASEYLIGREFDSLDSGLRFLQEKSQAGIRFYAGKVDIRPRELPVSITRIPIMASWSIEGEPQAKLYEVAGLVAKVKE